MYDNTPLNKDDITVSKLEQSIEEAFALKKAHAEMKADTAKKHAEYEEKCFEIGQMLEALELDKYQAKVGSFTKKLEEGYVLPKDDESRAQFFEYLKEKEMYDSMITINANTLNSYVKGEVELAEANNDFNFVPPGVVRKDPWTKFTLRKASK